MPSTLHIQKIGRLIDVIGPVGNNQIEKIAEAAEAAGVEGLDQVPLETLKELREEYAEEGMKALRALVRRRGVCCGARPGLGGGPTVVLPGAGVSGIAGTGF